MASVTFGLKELKAKGLDERKILEFMPKFGMEVESHGADEITVDITPNRPDLLDSVGMARQLRYFSGIAEPKEKGYKLSGSSGVRVEVGNGAASVRPFAACIAVKNANLSGTRLKDLINFTEKLAVTYGRKRRKMAIGLHNLGAVKGGKLTYDASRSGEFVPLDGKRMMTFEQIIKEHEKGMEYSDTVKTKGGTLSAFLKDEEKILAMIPIINSEATRVTESTSELLVFVDGTSKKTVNDTMKILACSFIDSGADVYSCAIKYKGLDETVPNLSAVEVRIRNSRIEKTIGARIDPDQMVSLANRMGYFGAKYGAYTLVYVPPYRADVLNEQDVIEDIAMAYGYDRIKPAPIPSSQPGMPDRSTERNHALYNMMVGLGFTEAMNMYLTNERTNFENMRRKYAKGEVMGLMNSKTESITMLRTSLLPCLLSDLRASTKERMPQKMFELGKVFSMEEGRINEQDRMALVSEHSKANFSEVRGVIGAIYDSTAAKYEVAEHSDPAFIEGRCAKVVVNGKDVAVFGEVHPAVLSNFKIEEPVVAAELLIG